MYKEFRGQVKYFLDIFRPINIFLEISIYKTSTITSFNSIARAICTLQRTACRINGKGSRSGSGKLPSATRRRAAEASLREAYDASTT